MLNLLYVNPSAILQLEDFLYRFLLSFDSMNSDWEKLKDKVWQLSDIDRDQEAQFMLLDFLKENPDHQEGWENLAMIYHEQWKYKRSLRAYGKAELLSKEEDPYQVQKFDLEMHLMNAQFHSKRIESHPARIQFREGSRALQTDELDSAEEHFNKALELEGEHPLILLNLGLIYHKKKLWTKAMNTYESILQKEPRYALALFNLGTLHMKMETFGSRGKIPSQSVFRKSGRTRLLAESGSSADRSA